MKSFAFLDLEGVLFPEIWEIYAQKLNIPELAITTREEPNFKKLVSNRINILKDSNITIERISKISKEIEPLNGSIEFLHTLKTIGFNIIIVTDAFWETINECIKKIEFDAIFPNYFKFDLAGCITEPLYSRACGKHEVLEHTLNMYPNSYSIAVGDTFNDFTMLNYAKDGFLFNPSDQALKMANLNFKIVHNYNQIIEFLNKH